MLEKSVAVIQMSLGSKVAEVVRKMQGCCVHRSQGSINPTQRRAANSRGQRLDYCF